MKVETFLQHCNSREKFTPEEEAVAIPGFKPYRITRNGKVFSDYMRNGRGVIELKPNIVKPKNRITSGYLRYSLRVNGIAKSMLLHRLIAITFIPNPLNLPQVNHIDGNKLNNDISNLEWCTGSQNLRHAYEKGLRIKKKGLRNARSKPVVQSKNGVTVGIWENSLRAAEFLGYSQHNITAVARKTRATYKGYNWEYITKEEYCLRNGIELKWKEIETNKENHNER